MREGDPVTVPVLLDVDEVARRNGGRVLRAMADSLGEYVVRDFLRARREQ